MPRTRVWEAAGSAGVLVPYRERERAGPRCPRSGSLTLAVRKQQCIPENVARLSNRTRRAGVDRSRRALRLRRRVVSEPLYCPAKLGDDERSLISGELAVAMVDGSRFEAGRD